MGADKDKCLLVGEAFNWWMSITATVWVMGAVGRVVVVLRVVIIVGNDSGALWVVMAVVMLLVMTAWFSDEVCGGEGGKGCSCVNGGGCNGVGGEGGVGEEGKSVMVGGELRVMRSRDDVGSKV